MRRSLLLSLLALPLVAAPVLAQPGPVFPGPGTLLRISESAEVTRAPDEVGAVLRYEARGAAAAGAQSAVNRVMTAALEAARGVPGITASTGAYNTWRQAEPAGWVASQALTLRGGDAAALLELVGSLQGRGMALDGIEHRLTRDSRRTARQEASSQAIEALRRRAEVVAGEAGMRVERIAELTVEEAPPTGPRPMMMEARGARAAAAPPVAAAEDIVVSASVQAVVVLVPR